MPVRPDRIEAASETARFTLRTMPDYKPAMINAAQRAFAGVTGQEPE